MNGQMGAACFGEMWLFAKREQHAKEVRMHVVIVQNFAHQNGTDLKRAYRPLRKHRSILRQIEFHSFFVPNLHDTCGGSDLFCVDGSTQLIAIVVDLGTGNPYGDVSGQMILPVGTFTFSDIGYSDVDLIIIIRK